MDEDKTFIPSSFVGRFATAAVDSSSESKMQRFSNFSSSLIRFCLNRLGLCAQFCVCA